MTYLITAWVDSSSTSRFRTRPRAAGLWDRCLGRRIPRVTDLDLDFCTGAFELSGGNIRSAVVSAAYPAAKDDRSVRAVDLVASVYQVPQAWAGPP